jgi:alpha-D-xyloside xylohydrolase
VLPVGARDDTPEYAWAQGVTLRAFDLPDGYASTVRVPGGTGPEATFRVRRDGDVVVASTDDAPAEWSLEIVGGPSSSASGAAEVRLVVGGE